MKPKEFSSTEGEAAGRLSPWREIESALKLLGEAREWTQAGQYGDQNGAKAYQADKYLGDAINRLQAIKPIPPAPHSNGERDDETCFFPKRDGNYVLFTETEADKLCAAARASLSPWREIERKVLHQRLAQGLQGYVSAHLASELATRLIDYIKPWGLVYARPAPHSNGERDDGDKHTGRNWSDKDSGSASGRLADSDVHSSVALPSDASDIAELVERLRFWKPRANLIMDEHRADLEDDLEQAAAALLALTAELERVRGYLKRAHEEAGVELLDAKRQIRAQAREIADERKARSLVRQWLQDLAPVSCRAKKQGD